MALTRQVITALNNDGTDMLGTRNVAIKIVDEEHRVRLAPNGGVQPFLHP